MKLIITVAICILTLRVECQSFYNQDQQYNRRSGPVFSSNPAQDIFNQVSNIIRNVIPIQNVPTGPGLESNTQSNNQQVANWNGIGQQNYVRDNTPFQQNPNNQQFPYNDGSVQFPKPNVEENPSSGNVDPYYYTEQNNNGGQGNINNAQTQDTNSLLNNGTVAISDFGLILIKIASQLRPGNLIISPMSIATSIALLQQGATGVSQNQITSALQMYPEQSLNTFSAIAANLQRRQLGNVLISANKLYVSNKFNLKNTFQGLASQGFGSEVSSTNFANSLQVVRDINAWVTLKTNNKITNLLGPGAVSPSTQIVLVNAVYFKGLWEKQFKPERTKTDIFHLNNGEKKSVSFMNTRSSFQAGFDLNTRAQVTILPFEGRQYSMILILPKKTDNVANVLSTLTVEQLLNYQNFNELDVILSLPKFTLKTDTNLEPVLKNMGITNIFKSQSGLDGIGTYKKSPPEITNAIHSGYLSIDEQGVTAAASTAFVAIALSYDDGSFTFRADRPFIAVLWDNQFAIPIFIAKIEDPS